jgi:hypothetical protein
MQPRGIWITMDIEEDPGTLEFQCISNRYFQRSLARTHCFQCEMSTHETPHPFRRVYYIHPTRIAHLVGCKARVESVPVGGFLDPDRSHMVFAAAVITCGRSSCSQWRSLKNVGYSCKETIHALHLCAECYQRSHSGTYLEGFHDLPRRFASELIYPYTEAVGRHSEMEGLSANCRVIMHDSAVAVHTKGDAQTPRLVTLHPYTLEETQHEFAKYLGQYTTQRKWLFKRIASCSPEVECKEHHFVEAQKRRRLALEQ